MQHIFVLGSVNDIPAQHYYTTISSLSALSVLGWFSTSLEPWIDNQVGPSLTCQPKRKTGRCRLSRIARPKGILDQKLFIVAKKKKKKEE